MAESPPPAAGAGASGGPDLPTEEEPEKPEYVPPSESDHTTTEATESSSEESESEEAVALLELLGSGELASSVFRDLSKAAKVGEDFDQQVDDMQQYTVRTMEKMGFHYKVFAENHEDTLFDPQYLAARREGMHWIEDDEEGQRRGLNMLARRAPITCEDSREVLSESFAQSRAAAQAEVVARMTTRERRATVMLPPVDPGTPAVRPSQAPRPSLAARRGSVMPAPAMQVTGGRRKSRMPNLLDIGNAELSAEVRARLGVDDSDAGLDNRSDIPEVKKRGGLYCHQVDRWRKLPHAVV